MGAAKGIILRPIGAAEADVAVKRWHYSGKVVNNSQPHIGVFYGGKLEGAMQFGPSLDKRKIMGLVEGTGWNEFIELNRMAFSDALPRNSESRALAIAMRQLRQHALQVKWVISFADATQSGDGAIYRASGFVLTGIKENDQIWRMGDGEIATRMVATDTRRPERQRLLSRVTMTKGQHVLETGGATMRAFVEAGARPLPGFQLRYIYFLDPSCRARLTVPELPYSEIERRGAGMYRGQKVTRGLGETDNAPRPNEETGGARPTSPL